MLGGMRKEQNFGSKGKEGTSERKEGHGDSLFQSDVVSCLALSKDEHGTPYDPYHVIEAALTVITLFFFVTLVVRYFSFPFLFFFFM